MHFLLSLIEEIHFVVVFLDNSFFGSSSQEHPQVKKAISVSSHFKMATSVEVATTHPPPMEISGDAHGSAAVVPTTAAPGVHHPIPPGATAANTRVRSNSRTPERGRTSSRSALQVVAMSPPTAPTEEAAKKRRASSMAPPTTPTTPPRANASESNAKLLGMVAKLQQQIDALNRDKLRFESDVLKRMEEHKEFAAKSTRAFIGESCRDVLAGIEAEFSIGDRLKAHLIGRNEPVFETLFNQFHDPKMAALDIKIDELQAWVRERNTRDAQVESYITNLERDRPGEGIQIKMAFQSIVEEIMVLRSNAAAAAQAATMTHDGRKAEPQLPSPTEPSPAHMRTPGEPQLPPPREPSPAHMRTPHHLDTRTRSTTWLSRSMSYNRSWTT